MIRSHDIVAYTYRADVWCPDCISREFGGLSAPRLDAEGWLDRAARGTGLDRMDEASYDSGDFPKVVFADQIEDEEHCGQCGEAIL